MSTPTQVLVLPFVNLSGDARNEHVADGLTELVIMHLAAVQSLRVVSRTSSMHYKFTRRRLADIARELDVARVVEGSILQSAQAFQVVVQVIDAATDTHVLSRTYARSGGDTLEWQNEIARVVATDIAAHLDNATWGTE